jgi:IS605 OrfB family transposase
MLVKGVAFRLASDLPPEAILLLQEFRLAVNKAVRASLDARVSSRNGISKLLYRTFREEHPGMYSQHLVSSFEVAAGILKNYRKRLRHGRRCGTPFVKRLMMKAENQAYKLDRAEGMIDLPIRAGCHVKLRLVVSRYHRRYLNDETLSLGSLTVLPNRVIVAFRREFPRQIAASSVLSLDTNERSLDGIFVEGGQKGDGRSVQVEAAFPEVAVIQQRHHERRRRLQKKKAHDRRSARALCRRDGAREHHRIDYRLHRVANAVIEFAEGHESAIVLEDLRGMRPNKGKELNRRLSFWPRRKLHQVIEYKAAWKGIPIVKVDPRYSSRRCSACGRIPDSRMGTRTEFACDCGWHLDRHVNASMNLLQTAISKGLEVAGGLRFSPGAFQHDVVMILYEPAMAARSEPNGTSHNGVTSQVTTRMLTEPCRQRDVVEGDCPPHLLLERTGMVRQ